MKLSALLYVLGEPGEKVTERDFSDWYDGEHAPARLTVPGFTSAARYRAIDSQKPTWLAIYDMDHAEVATSEAYTSLMQNASQREKDLIPKTESLQRRIYSPVSATANNHSHNANFLVTVEMQLDKEHEETFNHWYEEEHISKVSSVPGWITSHKFKLFDYKDLSGKSSKPPASYLMTSQMQSKPEGDAEPLYLSDWEEGRAGSITKREIRIFKLHKEFVKP